MSGRPHCPTCGQEVRDLPRLDELAVAMSLSGDMKRLFTILSAARGRFIDRQDIIEIMWGDCEDGGPEDAAKSIGVLIFRLRERLAGYYAKIEGAPPRGARHVRLIWAIETQHWRGWQLVKVAA